MDLVIVKSYKSGFRLILDPEADFSEILYQIGKKFAEGRTFFGTASVVLNFEGRILSEEEEIQILDVIHDNCDLKIICIIGKDADTEHSFMKAISSLEKRMKSDDSGFFYKGSIINNQVFEIEESVVIMGDVNPGSCVVSGGSIIVLGGLYGEALAGRKQDKDAFVVALEMNPEHLEIGDVTFTPAVKPKWGIKPKVAPKIAYVKEEAISFDALTRQNLESIYAL